MRKKTSPSVSRQKAKKKKIGVVSVYPAGIEVPCNAQSLFFICVDALTRCRYGSISDSPDFKSGIWAELRRSGSAGLDPICSAQDS